LSVTELTEKLGLNQLRRKVIIYYNAIWDSQVVRSSQTREN